MELQSVRMGGCLNIVPALGTLFLLWVAVSNFKMTFFALSYILFCYVWLLSLEAVLF